MPFRPILSTAASLALLAMSGWAASAQYASPPIYRGGPGAELPPIAGPRADDRYGRTVYQGGPVLYGARIPDDDEIYDPLEGYNPHQGYSSDPTYDARDPMGAPRYDQGPGPAVTGGVIRPPVGIAPGGYPGSTLASLPVEDQPETGEPKELPPQFKRQTVAYATKEPAGSIIIDTQNTYLYYVLGKGMAIRYGIGVGREGFTWSGVEKISRLAEWPDWHPPAEMIERQPYLPRFMAGGPGNPMGARALYLGKTVYRIHGTNQPSTIGQFVSSGCIRMLNEDVEDLYTRVKVGSKVVVLPGSAPASASNMPPAGAPAPTAANAPVVR